MSPLLVRGMPERELLGLHRAGRAALMRAREALHRYWRLCDALPPGQEPQCWMAETEIGEAWRAMPRWLRAGLLLYPHNRLGMTPPAWREAVWELRTPTEPTVQQ